MEFPGRLFEKGALTWERFRQEGKEYLSSRTRIRPALRSMSMMAFLQLTVKHDSVGDDHNIVKNDFIVCIMQKSQAVRQPCDGVCLVGVCTAGSDSSTMGT